MIMVLMGLMGLGLLVPSVAWAEAVPEKLAPVVKKQLKSGQNYYNKGYINKAIPAFRQALKSAPRSEVINLWLAKALIKQGGDANYVQAKEHLTRVLDANPEQGEAMLLLGGILGWEPVSRGQAIGLLKRALILQGEQPGQYPVAQKQIDEATRTLVNLLGWEGQYKEAAIYAQAIRQTYAHEKKWQATYARLLAHVGQAPAAVDLYDNYIQPMTSSEFPWKLDYIYALSKMGRQDKALSVFKQIQPELMASDKTNAVNQAASLAYDLGVYDSSLFETVIALDAVLPEAMQADRNVRLRHARALKQLRRHPEAIDAYYAVYESSEMRAEETLEFADYLNELKLISAELPEPNLVETLYRGLLDETDSPGDAYLRLARLYAAEDKGKGQAFKLATDSFEQAYLHTSDEVVRESVKKEFMDFIKSRPGQATDAVFRRLIAEYPQAMDIQGHYAEYLSWQEPRRREAIQLYLKLSVDDPQNHEAWATHMNEVLGWHRPEPSWIPIYNEVLSRYPDHRNALLAKARALATQSDSKNDAMVVYQTLRDKYPTDSEVAQEWAGLLSGQGKGSQRESLAMLKGLVEQNPSDVSARVAYGKQLSYRTRYRKAIKMFDSVLAEYPEHKEALIGKSYTLMWSGRKFEAKKLLLELQGRYPNDISVLLALASVHKEIGRYDKALDILDQIRYRHESLEFLEGLSGLIPCAHRAADASYSSDNLMFDFSMPMNASTAPPTQNEKKFVRRPFKAPVFEPYSTPVMVKSSPMPIQVGTPKRMSVVAERHRDPSPPLLSPELESLASELSALSYALDSLNEVQTQSGRQLKRLQANMWSMKHEITPSLAVIHSLDGAGPEEFGEPGRGPSHSSYFSYGSSYSHSGSHSGLGRPKRAYAQKALASNQPGGLLDPAGSVSDPLFKSVEADLFSLLRPEIRSGYGFQFQEGEPTTNELFAWSLPNQLSVYLTPQLKARIGVNPQRFYLPNSPTDPRSNRGIQYTVGATAQYWDRLRLEGDLGITHFTQTGKDNITYKAQAKIQLMDRVSLRVGGRRNTLANSLLAVAGYKPNQGAFSGQVLGPANENAFFVDLSTQPLPNTDFNLGYEWAVITGSNAMPNNFKNQFYTSMGYTHRFNSKHSLRAGYDFLYFTFSKNATNGFFDIESGVPGPLAVLRPVARADSGFDFGGYFSPDRFFLNTFRLDYRGSLFNKFLEYKLGGSLGVQAFEHGFGIQDSDPTSLSSAFNVALKMNFTDWLAAYGRTNFMDSGGVFSRWRFEGGLIVRPNIRALTPLFRSKGSKPRKPDRATIDRNAFPNADFDSQDYKFYN